jgi:hypothetical protein
VGLVALAGNGGQGGWLQAEVADGEVGEFLDPGCGVVEGGEQGRVAAAVPGGPVGLGEQAAGLLDGEVVDGRLRLPFGGDGEDVLAGGHPGGVLRLHPPVERADRGQALVASTRCCAGWPAAGRPVLPMCSHQRKIACQWILSAGDLSGKTPGGRYWDRTSDLFGVNP